MRFALQERSSSDVEPSTRPQYFMGADARTREAAVDGLLRQKIQSSAADALTATSAQRAMANDRHRYEAR
jgi:hypothetical protein